MNSFIGVDEEENEPLPADTVNFSSEEFKESFASVKVDPFDITAWMIALDEAAAGRGGDISPFDAYELFLNYFPKASKFWKRLSDFHCRQDRRDLAIQVLRNASHKCWNVEIWLEYLELLLLDGKSDFSSLQSVFEEALSRVGFDFTAGSLWLKYIRFIIQAGKENQTDPKIIFQRALRIPLDEIDTIWTEFSTFTKGNVENLDIKSQELHRLYLHAKGLAKDYKRLVGGIMFDRLSLPPGKNGQEVQELKLWDAWLCHEFTVLKSDRENAAKIRMIFEQCLACFYYHPEVWLAYAYFEKQILGDLDSAKLILKRGVTVFPDFIALPLYLSEILEEEGKIEETHSLIKSLFDRTKDRFTFSFYQLFLYRHFGRSASRLLFSSTFEFRFANPNESLQLYVAHASFEFHNCGNAECAMRILQSTKMIKTNHFYFPFFDLVIQILRVQGKFQEIRWILNNCISLLMANKFGELISSTALIHASLLDRNESTSFMSHSISATIIQQLGNDTLQWLRSFYNLYIELENIEKHKSFKFLHLLQENLRIVDQSLNFSEISCAGRSTTDTVVGFPALILLERYSHIAVCDTSEECKKMRKRCLALSQVIQGNKEDPRSDYHHSVSAASQITFSGLPSILREFVLRLPSHNGTLILSTENFLRQLKTIVLPPRPLEEDEKRESQIEIINSGNEDFFRKRQKKF